MNHVEIIERESYVRARVLLLDLREDAKDTRDRFTSIFEGTRLKLFVLFTNRMERFNE